jgi:hypothetical protein
MVLVYEKWGVDLKKWMALNQDAAKSVKDIIYQILKGVLFCH